MVINSIVKQDYRSSCSLLGPKGQSNAELTCKAVLAKQGWREVCHDKGKPRDKGRRQVELDVLRSFFNSFEADIGRFGMFDSTILLLVLSDIQQK